MFSCAQGNKGKEIEQKTDEIMKTIDIPKQYKQEPFYYCGIYSSNVKWELFINDVQMFSHYQGMITSPIVPLNYNILQTGKQKMTIRIYPSEGKQTLGGYATFRMRLFYNQNFRDENDPEIDILSYELPYAQTKGLPYVEKTFEFEAEVPYKLIGWTKSKDLTKVPDLEAKVVAKIEQLRKVLENKDTEAYIRVVMPKLQEQFVCLYATQTEIKNYLNGLSLVNSEALEGLKNIKILPINSYQIVLEPNNKVVKLRQSDKDGDIIDGVVFEGISEETGEIETGSYLFRFHIPEGSNELEVIR
ncbi:hypothetical protein C4S77_06105 [Apibacter adventoris]|uniref:Uncharacterized protein n=1 Tax=Apibacter adventoris TaxID=1679466 RepID=A0A2S8AE70_9FLAO|nr:hypothetical protein C4S77_06105 [Apibacter adventoris]